MEGAELFTFIIDASVALALTSIAALLMLFVRRVIIMRIDRANAQRRRELQDMVYGALDDPGKLSPRPLSARDQRLLLAVVSEMLRAVDGEMRDQLKDILARHIRLDRLLYGLKHGLPVDRAKIAARLFWSAAPEVHDALRAALDDPEPEVVLAAAGALMAAGQRIDLQTLTPKLEARRMLGNRAVRDLFRKLAPDNGAALFAFLDDPNPAVVVLAIDALARARSAAALKRLRAAAQTHPSVDVRAAAVRSLGNAQDHNAVGVVTAALSDAAWEVRAQAAIAAGRIGDAAALTQLAKLVHDANWWVRLRAAQALTRLGPDGIAALQAVSGDGEAGRLVEFVLSERGA
ncbi:MAG: HEAT repeat domain-containing protein [Rhodospirillaceae bacterium]|nr:HEAT repeat domain-containing protein [Rhodospirillaceae bacterium]